MPFGSQKGNLLAASAVQGGGGGGGGLPGTVVVDLNAQSLGLTNGDTVSTQWTSEGTDTGSTALGTYNGASSNGPEYSTTAMNGQPGVVFDAANSESLDFFLATPYTSTTDPVTFTWVMLGDGAYFDVYADGTTSGQRPRLFDSSTNTWFFQYGTNYETPNGTRDLGNNQIVTLAVDLSASPAITIDVYVDGSLIGDAVSVTGSAVEVDALMTGRISTGGYGNSTFGRILVWYETLTATQVIDELHPALATEWGVTLD